MNVLNPQAPLPRLCVDAHGHRIPDERSAAKSQESTCRPRLARSAMVLEVLLAGANGRCHHARFVRGRNFGLVGSAYPRGRACLPLSPGSNSIVPTAAVLPTLKMFKTPVLMPEELTTVATVSVRSCMSLCPWRNRICIRRRAAALQRRCGCPLSDHSRASAGLPHCCAPG